MKDCIFCKIVKKDLPASIVYEDDKVISFLDINPYSKGHILLIPRNHSRWLWDINIKDYNYLMERTHFLANILKKVFNTDWIEEVIAGMGVEHTHIHLLPRKLNDGLEEIPTKPLKPKPSQKEMEKIASQIRNLLKA